MSSINDNYGKINQIISQAKQQKQELQKELRDYISDSSSEVGESFDRKYLQKDSHLSCNHQQRPIGSLADEFLEEVADDLKDESSMQSQSIPTTNKTSYLKQNNTSGLNTTDPR